MKSSIVTSLVLLFGAINALPQSELEKRDDPDMVPVTFDQLPTTSFTCGKSQPVNKHATVDDSRI